MYGLKQCWLWDLQLEVSLLWQMLFLSLQPASWLTALKWPLIMPQVLFPSFPVWVVTCPRNLPWLLWTMHVSSTCNCWESVACSCYISLQSHKHHNHACPMLMQCTHYHWLWLRPTWMRWNIGAHNRPFLHSYQSHLCRLGLLFFFCDNHISFGLIFVQPKHNII